MNTQLRLTGRFLLCALLLSVAWLARAEHKGGMDLPYMPPLEMRNPQAQAKVEAIYGKVLETMNSGGYTYVHLDTGKQQVWAAGPITKVKVGDAVRVEADMPMKNLHSKTLKRDFALVYFSDSIIVAGQTAAQHGEMEPHAGDKRHEDIALGKIKKAHKGFTIAEIFKRKLHFAGKRVRVRGKVVRYTTNVMQNNWLHLRDNSTGKDLVVITHDKTHLGAVVVAEGIVSLNKDIGIKPIFEVVLEKSRLSNK